MKIVWDILIVWAFGAAVIIICNAAFGLLSYGLEQRKERLQKKLAHRRRATDQQSRRLDQPPSPVESLTFAVYVDGTCHTCIVRYDQATIVGEIRAAMTRMQALIVDEACSGKNCQA